MAYKQGCSTEIKPQRKPSTNVWVSVLCITVCASAQDAVNNKIIVLARKAKNALFFFIKNKNDNRYAVNEIKFIRGQYRMPLSLVAGIVYHCKPYIQQFLKLFLH